jgi:hypothetical protein
MLRVKELKVSLFKIGIFQRDMNEKKFSDYPDTSSHGPLISSNRDDVYPMSTESQLNNNLFNSYGSDPNMVSRNSNESMYKKNYIYVNDTASQNSMMNYLHES